MTDLAGAYLSRWDENIVMIPVLTDGIQTGVTKIPLSHLSTFERMQLFKGNYELNPKDDGFMLDIDSRFKTDLNKIGGTSTLLLIALGVGALMLTK